MAFMLVSNWMGSPKFRVESSAELEVSSEIMPQEGPSIMKGVPYDSMPIGEYEPGEVVEGNPYLTNALAEFEEAMHRYSCSIESTEWEPCEVTELKDGSMRYGNDFKDSVMPDPYAVLIVEQLQPDLIKMTLSYRVEDPQNPGELLIDTDWVDYRHADALYEEECRYINKDC